MSEISKLQAEVKELKEELNRYKQMVDDMSVPIIPSIIPETILIPISGEILPGRMEKIISEISSAMYKYEVNTVIIDFTAVGKNDIGEIVLFGEYVIKLNTTLNLLGIDVLYVGFKPSVSQEIVNSGNQTIKELKTFSTFRSALKYLMKDKGLKFL